MASKRGQKKRLNIKELPTTWAEVEFDAALAKELQKQNVELVLLIGYNKVLSKPFLDAFPNAILNVHPSLLPAFCGKFDRNVHEEVLRAGVKVSGATVHLVTEEIDNGPILLQKAVDVADNETPDSLKQKVQSLEQELLLKAIRLFSLNKLKRLLCIAILLMSGQIFIEEYLGRSSLIMT